MNRRIKNKLLKKRQRSQPPSVETKNSGIAPAELKGLAIECWRIRNLLPEFACSKKQPLLTSVVEKMTALLVSIGIEIEDPTGWDYKEGMTMNVALFEDNNSLPIGVRRITETVAPNVYVAGTLVQAARVIVSVGKADK